MYTVQGQNVNFILKFLGNNARNLFAPLQDDKAHISKTFGQNCIIVFDVLYER